MAEELSPMEVVEYYSRDDIAQEMVSSAQDREVGGRYRSGGFGKRPDVLMYPGDIKYLAKSGMSSFHFSVERWRNPKMLRAGMAKKELDALRIGWDLLLDLDPKDFLIGQIVGEGFIEWFKKQGFKNIDVKFSGNKGWHIAIPFESFGPDSLLDDKPLKDHFPDSVKELGGYLVKRVRAETDIVDKVKARLKPDEYNLLAGQLIFTWEDVPGYDNDKLLTYLTELMNIRFNEKNSTIEKTSDEGKIIVKSGSNTIEISLTENNNVANIRTGRMINQVKETKKLGVHFYDGKRDIFASLKDSSKEWTRHNPPDPFNIVEVDTLLMTNRHMIRMPYSLHEKSWLASVPLPYERGAISQFEKGKDARPDRVRVVEHFLSERPNEAEALSLFREAQKIGYERRIVQMEQEQKRMEKALSEMPAEAIEPVHFPPCIKRALRGMDDGRKRMEFILEGFLRKSGWSWGQVEAQLLEWDTRNRPSLGDGYIKNHIRYGINRGRDILPLNCRNTTFYKETGLCRPDAICKNIKNPISYPRISVDRMRKRKKGDGRKHREDDIPDNTRDSTQGEG